MKPYTGKVLWVDLSLGTFNEEQIPDQVYQQVLGGIGLGVTLLMREMTPGTDPLGPGNVLGFMPGLITGAGGLFTGRWMAVAKSPLTGTWGDSNCGGTLANAIKQCGYDGILFKGRSPNPVYFLCDAHGPKLRDAAEYWGRDAVETEEALLRLYGQRKLPAVAAIGQAGEALSLISGIVNDKGRLAARSGLGAVMGSKQLKAVVLAGSRRYAAHNPTSMRALSKKCSKEIKLSLSLVKPGVLGVYGRIMGKLPISVAQPSIVLGGVLAKWGTIGTIPASIGIGDTPFKNWQGSQEDMPRAYDRIDPDRVIGMEKRKYHCRECPLGCGGILELPGSKQLSHKPEYETAAGFSALLLNDNMDMIYEMNELLNRAGMDSISASGAVAFAMECFEKGWITLEDTGGLNLSWGNVSAIRQVVQQMIERKGFGALLTDGVKRAAAQLAPEVNEAAIHAGGQEMAFHDPRFDPGMGLHASVDPTPGRHTTGAQLYYDLYRLWTKIPSLPVASMVYAKATRYFPGNGRTTCAVAVSKFTQFYNAAGACYTGLLIGVDRVPIFEWMNAATGWNLSPEQYLIIGHRIQTLRQMFNIREGIDPHSLKVSRRLLGDPPQQAGPNRGVSYDIEALMRAYWDEIGWGAESGVPRQAVIEALGIPQLMQAVSTGGAA